MIRDGIMMYNNLNINNKSMVHSIASTTKSNQHRESFPYELMQDSTQLLQQYGDGDEGADGDDDGGDDDDDPDEVQLDGGVDGDDLPSPGRNSLGRNLSAGEIFLSRCFPPRRGGRIFLWSLP